MRRLTQISCLTTVLVAGLLLAGCAPAPRFQPSSLPPPPEQSTRPCPGPRPPCATRPVCAYDRDRGCMVCRCGKGHVPQDHQRRRDDPRWVVDGDD